MIAVIVILVIIGLAVWVSKNKAKAEGYLDQIEGEDESNDDSGDDPTPVTPPPAAPSTPAPSPAPTTPNVTVEKSVPVLEEVK